MGIRYVNGAQAPQPAGHYSQATVVGELVFISGQLPIDIARESNDLNTSDSFDVQAACAINNVLQILSHVGGSVSNIAKVSAYIVGTEHWHEFDKVYASLLGPARPARIIVPVPELHFGYLVEVEAVAAGTFTKTV